MQKPIKYEVIVGDRDIPADACTLGLFSSVEEAKAFIAEKRASGLYSDRLYFEIFEIMNRRTAMPNWCTNYVEIKTDDPELYQAMLTRIEAAQGAKEDHQGFFNSFIPCPAELLDTDLTTWGGSEDEQTAREAKKAANKDKYGHTDWYDWRCEKWGTKWDVRDIEYHDGGDCVELRFETAWSPPIPIYEEMERLGYRVKAKYGDEMMNFVGDWSNGIDKCYSLDHVPDRLKDFVTWFAGEYQEENQEENDETTV